MSIYRDRVLPYNSRSNSQSVYFLAYAGKHDLIESESVKSNIGDVYANSTAVQAYIVSCLTQKNVNLDKIPLIKSTQLSMREHAKHWSDELLPKIANTYTQVTGFCDKSSAYWGVLIDLANQISKTPKDIKTRNQFKKLIEVLQRDIESREKETNLLVNSLFTFNGYLEDDNRNFQEIITQSASIYEGNQGELTTTRNIADAAQTAINKDIAIIAGGAVGIVAGIVTIGVGAIGTIFTGGAAAKVVAVGVVLTIGGVAAVTVASLDLEKKKKEYAAALIKIATLEAELAALQNTKTNFTGLRDSNDKAHDAVDGMRTGWINIKNNFNELAKSVDDIDLDENIAFLLPSSVEATKNTFNSLKAIALDAQLKSVISVKLEPELAASLELSKKTFYSFDTYCLSTKRYSNDTSWTGTLQELAWSIR